MSDTNGLPLGREATASVDNAQRSLSLSPSFTFIFYVRERDSSLTMISGRHVSATTPPRGLSLSLSLSPFPAFICVCTKEFFFLSLLLPLKNSWFFFLSLPPPFFKDRNFTRLYASVSYYAVSSVYTYNFVYWAQVLKVKEEKKKEQGTSGFSSSINSS